MNNINYEELGFLRIQFDPMNSIREKYNVKQSDTKSRGFYVQVIQAGEIKPPSAGNILSFYGKKPDGNEVFVNAEIRDDEYVITLPNQVFALPGTIETELTLQGPNLEKITIKGPNINVLETYSTDAVESSNDFSALTQALSQLASFMGELEDVQLYAQNLSELVGNTVELDTVAKENLVLAINELVLKMEDFITPEEVETYLTDKVDNITLGDMMLLLTQDNETVVGAINELKADLDAIREATSAEELIGIFTSKADKTMIGDLGTLATAAKTNVVEAINEIYNAITELYQGLDVEAVNNLITLKVGDTTLLPNGNPDVVSAIIEINSALSEIQSVTDVASLTALISGKADKSQLNALVNTVANKADSAVIGVLGNLLTINKTNLVNAINEVKSSIDNFNGGLTEEDVLVITDSKVDEEAFLTEIGRIDGELLNKLEMADVEGMIGGKVGDMSTLSTIAKDTVVNAINEIYGALDGTVATGDIATILMNYALSVDLETLDGKVGDVSLLNTMAKDNLVNAINELNINITENGGVTEQDVKYLVSNVTGDLNNLKKGVKPSSGLIVDAINIIRDRLFGENNNQSNVTENNQISGSYNQSNACRSVRVGGNFSQINASNVSIIRGDNSQINACDGYSMDYPNYIELNVKGSQINASNGTGNGNKILSAANYSQINSSFRCSIGSPNSQVNSSKQVYNKYPYTSAWGYIPSAASESTSTSYLNIKILLESITGDIKHSGVLTSGHAFTDYAEIFPNITGAAQEPGLIQTVDSIGKFGYGVRPANEGEGVVGVVSAMAGVILGDTPFSWQGRWLKDEWGAFIMHDIEVETGEVDEEGNPIMETMNVPKENPDFNPDLDFQPRKDRPDEWTVVGMVGQVYVRLKEDVQALDYVKPWLNGVGQKSVEATNIRVMKITQPYNAEKGYAIGFCLLK